MTIDKLIKDFITAFEKDLSYNEPAKNLFHTRGLKLLKQIAIDLGYTPATYDVRSNKGGIAVSGEITLHTDNLYMQISQFGGLPPILYRSCKGRKDFCGGGNNFMQLNALHDYGSFLEKLLSVTGSN